MNKEDVIEKLLADSIAKSMKEEGFSPRALSDSMSASWNKSIDKEIKGMVGEKKKVLRKKIKELEKDLLEKLMNEADIPKKIVVSRKGVKGVVQVGVTHKKFKDLLTLVSNEIPVMLVGEPGTGKTYSAEKVAKSLKVPFHALSIGQQTTKSDILGFVNANGKIVKTPFRKAFELGGVFLMDEIDAGNPNVLIQINSAISNGFCEFQDKMVHAHKNFRFIATANTFGNGINTRFVGRNKLDAATLDRFVFLPWDVDVKLERMLVNNDEWLDVIEVLRKLITKNGAEVFVTTRGAQYGSKLLEMGFKKEEVLEMAIYKGMPDDIVKWLKDGVIAHDKKVVEAEEALEEVRRLEPAEIPF